MRLMGQTIQRFVVLALITCFTLIGCKANVPKPPEATVAPGIATLSKMTGMTRKAQNIFYAQQPKIIPSKAFYSRCSRSRQGHESSVILGCFTRKGGEGRIFIQSIKDIRLKGTMEVVAAHEMLHAAYSTLNSGQRSELAPKLEKAVQYYENRSILSILERYKNTSPETYLNELHSYLGTELEELHDSWLDQYYQQFFKDRKKLVLLAQNSQNELYTYENKARTLENEISNLKSYLEGEKAYLSRAVKDIQQFEQSLSREQRTIDSKISKTPNRIIGGDYNALDGFNQEQKRLSQKGDRIEEMIREYQNRSLDYQTKVDEYNYKVQEYKQITKNREDILKIIRNQS